MKFYVMVLPLSVWVCSLSHGNPLCSAFLSESYSSRHLKLVEEARIQHSGIEFQQGDRVDVYMNRSRFSLGRSYVPQGKSAILLGSYSESVNGSLRTLLVLDFGKGEIKIMEDKQIQRIAKSYAQIKPSVSHELDGFSRAAAWIYVRFIKGLHRTYRILPLATVLVTGVYVGSLGVDLVLSIPSLEIVAPLSLIGVGLYLKANGSAFSYFNLRGVVYLGKKYIRFAESIGVPVAQGVRFAINTIANPKESYNAALDLLSLLKLRSYEYYDRSTGQSRLDKFGNKVFSKYLDVQGPRVHFRVLPSKSSLDPDGFRTRANNQVLGQFQAISDYLAGIGLSIKTPLSIIYVENGGSFNLLGPSVSFSKNFISTVVVSPVNVSRWQGVSFGALVPRAQGEGTQGFLARELVQLAIQTKFGVEHISPVLEAFLVDYLSLRVFETGVHDISPRLVNGETPLREGLRRNSRFAYSAGESHLNVNSLAQMTGRAHLDSQVLLKLAVEYSKFLAEERKLSPETIDQTLMSAISALYPRFQDFSYGTFNPDYLALARKETHQYHAYKFVSSLYEASKSVLGINVAEKAVLDLAEKYGFDSSALVKLGLERNGSSIIEIR